MQIKVSIIIPFYKRHDNLCHCLKALSYQRYTNFEVIVSTYLLDDKLIDIVTPFKNRLKIRLINTTEVELAKWNISYIKLVKKK